MVKLNFSWFLYDMVCIVIEEKKYFELNCFYYRIYVRGIFFYVVFCMWLSVNNYFFFVLLSKRIIWKFLKISYCVNIIFVKKIFVLLNIFKEFELYIIRYMCLLVLWKK